MATISQLMARAEDAWRRGAFEMARRDLRRVLTLAPARVDAKKMIAMVEQRLGDHAKAVGHFRDVLATSPRDESLHTGLAISLSELGAGREAANEFRTASLLRPQSAYVWANLGESLARENAIDDALRALRRAVSIDPNFVPARLCLARVHVIIGDVRSAESEFRQVLVSQPGNVEAWFGLSYLNMPCFTARDVDQMRNFLVSVDLPPTARERLTFALAKALETLGDYDAAFREFQSANNVGKYRVRWNAPVEHKRIEAIAAAFSKLEPAKPAEGLGRGIIFIASLPRSGSTLVEAMVASHPDVDGGNETRCLAQVFDKESHRRHKVFSEWAVDASADDWHRLGCDYMECIRHLRSGRSHFTDKSLLNWQLVGPALLALPDARVVLVERDAVETCLACYRQCLGTESGFACDMDWTADCYIDFVRLSRLWREMYAERIFYLHYESLLRNPEDLVRDLLTFCNLSFDERCLEFYATKRPITSLPSASQVRQPLRHTTARAHLYGHRLDGLRKRLGSAGLFADEANVWGQSEFSDG